MNRILFLLLCVLFFTSCDDDENIIDDVINTEEPTVNEEKRPVVLNKQDILLYKGETAVLEVDTNFCTTFKTRREFVATVSERGEITGEHVGTTYITAKSDNNIDSVRVEVLPRYNTYKEPEFLTWGIKKSAILKKLGEPDGGYTGGLVYLNYSEEISRCQYMFNEDDGLSSIMLSGRTENIFEYVEFLSERYIFINEDEGNYAFVSDTISKTSSNIVLSLYAVNMFSILYFSNS